MSVFLKAAAVTAVCVLSAVIVHIYRPEYSFFTQTAGIVCLGLLLLPQLRGLMSLLKGYYSLMGEAGEYFTLFAKAAVIACLSAVLTHLCRDTGNTALGYFSELTGKLGILTVCVPLIRQVLGAVTSLLQ